MPVVMALRTPGLSYLGHFASFLLGNRNWESEGRGVTEKGPHAVPQPAVSGGREQSTSLSRARSATPVCC